jgi:hypothetical protein
VPDLVDRLLDAWTALPPDDATALATFRAVYADPVLVNGTPMSCADLVARARALHRAFDGLAMELVDRFDAPGRSAIAHRARGRHVGPVATPLGELAPTGRTFEANLTIDILTIADDKVTEIWVVGDDLGRLAQLGGLALVQP